MKKLLYIAIVSSMLLSSCIKPNKTETEARPKRIITNKILFILGKDYYQRQEILKYFINDYSLNKKDSKIDILNYDEMLTKSGNIILRKIYEKIDESNCDIIIALGSPEGTGRYLLQAKNKYPEKVYISLLPMEETLRLEATCDIVVDFKLPDTLMNEEESFTVSDEKIELLLVASVFAAEDILANEKNLKQSPYDEFNRAFFTAYSVLFSKYKNASSFRLSPYVDPSSSIPSRKYFIVYENDETSPVKSIRSE